MYYELSKRDKKIARRCIDSGLEAEFKEGLENFHAITQQWREGKFASNKVKFFPSKRLLFLFSEESPASGTLTDLRIFQKNYTAI